jgi:hypothetical protein
VTDDIVTRLRADGIYGPTDEILPLSREAADEIEQLRETEQDLRMYLEQDACEIERLRTALGLACGLLSTYYAMSPPDQLMQQFLEEASDA